MKKLLKTLLVTVLGAVLVCTMSATLLGAAEDVIVYQEDFSTYADGVGYGADNADVYRAVGNQLVSSAQYNNGVSPLIETGLSDNWEYSADIMYPTGFEGYFGINILGLFTAAPEAFTEFTVQKTTDGYILFIKKDGTQVGFSTDYNRGGVNTAIVDNGTIGFDKVVTLRIVKFGNIINMYLNDIWAISKSFEGMSVPKQFNPYHWMDAGVNNFVGFTLDNVVLKNITQSPSEVYFENFDNIANDTLYGQGSDVFKVQNGKILTTQQFEQGTVPVLAENLPENFDIRMDISFPEGANGYFGLNLMGLINGFPTDSTEFTIQKGTDESYAFIKNIKNVSTNTLYTIYSNDSAAGGMAPSFNVEYGTENTFRIVKFNNQIELYINDTLLIKNYIKDMTKISAINLYHWDATGVSIDNVTVNNASPVSGFIYEPGEVLYSNNFDALPNGWAVGNDYDGGIVAADGVLRAINGNQNFGRQVSWLSAYGVGSYYNFETSFDAIFPAGALGAAGFTIDIRDIAATVAGRVDLEIARLADNVGNIIIRDGNGQVVANNTVTALGGKNTFTIADDTAYTVKIVKSDFQIEIYVDDVLMVKTAMEFDKVHADSFLYASTNSNIGIDNFQILGVNKITEIINIGEEVRELPEGVYFAESFNVMKLNDELYTLKDSNGGRLLTTSDGWKEPFIGNFTTDKFVSANFKLISSTDLQPRAGFYMNYANRIYVDARLSEDGTEIYVVISKDGELIAINNDVSKGGKIPSIAAYEDMFNLSYSVTEEGTNTLVKAYINGQLAAEATVELVAGEGVDYRLFTANTVANVDDLIITSVAYRANAVSDYYYDTTEFTAIARFEDFNGKTAGAYLDAFGNENFGFVIDEYGNAVVAQTTKHYNASYTGPDNLEQFTIVAQMRDLGTFDDGTNHVGGITTRFQNVSRNDVEIKTEASALGTVIQIYTVDGICQLDYKDVSKGGGFNPDLVILPGTKFTVSIYMQERNFVTVYINDVKVIQGFLPEASIGGFGFRSWNSAMEYDNLTIAGLQSTYADGTALVSVPVINVPVEGGNLSTSSIELIAGENAVIRANTAPYDATPHNIKWFVNGVEVVGATTNEFTFTNTVAGEYLITCEMDGILSAAKTITITSTEDPEDNNFPVWAIILIIIGGLAAVGGGVFFFLKKKTVVKEVK